MLDDDLEFVLNCTHGVAVVVDGELREIVLYPEPPNEADYQDLKAESDRFYPKTKVVLRPAEQEEIDEFKSHLK